jgi:plastocyanin
MSFFNHGSERDFHWLAGMTSAAGLLVMAAMFLSGAGTQERPALSFFDTDSSQTAAIFCGVGGNCASNFILQIEPSESTVTLGQPISLTIRISSYDYTRLLIDGVDYFGGNTLNGTNDYFNTLYPFYPDHTTVYSLHGRNQDNYNVMGQVAATVTVVCPAGQNGTPPNCSTPPPPSCSNGLNISQYPSCSCPAGQHQEGASCVPNSCANGLNISQYPSCSCPQGQVQSGSSCVAPIEYGQPTASISADDTSIEVGQSTGIHATFAAGTNDTLAGANIDRPEGTGLAANANPGNKDITFTPSAPGSYTFYARVATAHYGWQTKATITVNVTAVPPVPVPGVPQGLSASCNAAGTQANTSWNSVSGADHYWVGFDDTTNNASSCQDGWLCAAPDYSGNQTGTSRSFSTISGHQNRLLVASCNAQNNCSAANELAFTCNTPAPSLSIVANGQTGLANIPVNTPVTIAWSSDNVEAGSCRTTNNSGDGVVWQEDDSSGHNVGALSTTHIYTLNCRRINGAPVSAAVTVSIQPGAIDGPLTAAPARVQQGKETHLSWHTVGMLSCTVGYNTQGGGQTGISSALASSDKAATITRATTFTLTCTDGTHTFSQSVDVGVLPVVREE